MVLINYQCLDLKSIPNKQSVTLISVMIDVANSHYRTIPIFNHWHGNWSNYGIVECQSSKAKRKLHACHRRCRLETTMQKRVINLSYDTTGIYQEHVNAAIHIQRWSGILRLAASRRLHRASSLLTFAIPALFLLLLTSPFFCRLPPPALLFPFPRFLFASSVHFITNKYTVHQGIYYT